MGMWDPLPFTYPLIPNTIPTWIGSITGFLSGLAIIWAWRKNGYEWKECIWWSLLVPVLYAINGLGVWTGVYVPYVTSEGNVVVMVTNYVFIVTCLSALLFACYYEGNKVEYYIGYVAAAPIVTEVALVWWGYLLGKLAGLLAEYYQTSLFMIGLAGFVVLGVVIVCVASSEKEYGRVPRGEEV